tara:strand:- start:81 stop:1046 length:966 start_codon:yes stop_codon:yes gene_type:complete
MSRNGVICLHPGSVTSFDVFKKNYLLFDEILVLGADEFIAYHRDDEQGVRSRADELEMLIGSQIFTQLNFDIEDLQKVILGNPSLFDPIKEALLAYDELEKTLKRDSGVVERHNSIKITLANDKKSEEHFLHLSDFQEFVKTRNKFYFLRDKYFSELLNAGSQDVHYPLSDPFFDIGLGQNRDVMQIVFKSFPMIRDTVSWRELYEFRNEDETKLKILRFRNFARKLSKENVSIVEAKEEVEWMLEEYRHHMNIAKMKYESGILEGIFMTSLKFVENFIRLKPSEAFGSLYTLRENKIALIDIENSSPGKEVAFLSRAEEL